MKKFYALILTLSFISVGFQTGPVNPVEEVTIDTAKSTIYWKGYKPTGSHEGSLNFTSGSLKIEDGKIKGGAFKVDMSTIEDSEDNKRLEGHLRSADFFEIEVYPTASFVIKSVNTNDGQLTITGDMTIKDVTKELEFSATFTEESGSYVLTSEKFQINRADFNVKYKSKTFFNDLKDKFINDDFDLQVTIVSSK
jgi:polyisoprenoid-binding protein YceI